MFLTVLRGVPDDGRQDKCCIVYINNLYTSSSSSSIGTTAHCGLWPVEQCPSIFSYMPPTLSIFSLPALEDLFVLPLSIFSSVFPFFSSLPVLEWRSFWASCPPPFALGDLTCLFFVLLIYIYIYIYIYICVCVCVCVYSVHRWIYCLRVLNVLAQWRTRNMFATLDSQTDPITETLVCKNIRISQIPVNSGLAGMVTKQQGGRS